jgi:type IV pilus assembly protein PilE
MSNFLLIRDRQASARSHTGFTLVELMITVVIVSILAAIAIPSYSTYVQKSRRTEAKSALLTMASLEERYFSTNNTYTAAPSNLGYPAGTALPFTIGSGYYQITGLAVVAATAPANANSVGTPASYTITATTFGTQTSDTGCVTFTISSTGQQTATGTYPTCWQ